MPTEQDIWKEANALFDMDYDYHGAPELSETNTRCQAKYLRQAKQNLPTLMYYAQPTTTESTNQG